MGVGGWGVGDGDLGPSPNPQSPIPNPQSPLSIFQFRINKNLNLINIKINN